MKKLVLSFIFCMTYVVSSAQITSTYQYDTSGNIISRKISGGLIMKAAANDTPNEIVIHYGEGDKVSVETTCDEKDEKMVRIYDSNTNILHSETFTGTSYSKDISTFPNGMYILEVDTPDNTQSQTILKR